MFYDFALMVDLEFHYDNYVEECKNNNVEPLTFKEWYESLE